MSLPPRIDIHDDSGQFWSAVAKVSKSYAEMHADSNSDDAREECLEAIADLVAIGRGYDIIAEILEKRSKAARR